MSEVVYGVKRQLHEERLLAVLLNEGASLLAKQFGGKSSLVDLVAISPQGSLLEAWAWPSLLDLNLKKRRFHLGRMDEVVLSAAAESVKRLEAMVHREAATVDLVGLRAAIVELAEISVGVAGLLQQLGNRRQVRAMNPLPAVPEAALPSWVASGHQSRFARRCRWARLRRPAENAFPARRADPGSASSRR